MIAEEDQKPEKSYMKSNDTISNDEALEVIQKINALEQYALQLKEEDKSYSRNFQPI